jgi:ribosome-associated translation inhibitor RaiA
MHVDIQTRDITPTDELRAHVARRFQLAPSHFQDQALLTTVCLSGESGDSGEGRHCYLPIRAKGYLDVAIEDIETGLYIAINRAVARAGRMLERQWPRAHKHLNGSLQCV